MHIREQLSSLKNKIKQFLLTKYNSILDSIASSPQDRKLKDELTILPLYILIYGLLVNYALFAIFHLPFNLITIPAWGVAFYLVKEEFPEFVKKCKR